MGVADFSGRENDELRALRDVLKSIQDRMGLPQLTALLTIAVEPGISVNDLAERNSIPQQSASRYVAMLLARYENSGSSDPVLPLIEQELNVNDPRKRALYLNTHGRALAELFLLASARGSTNDGSK